MIIENFMTKFCYQSSLIFCALFFLMFVLFFSGFTFVHNKKQKFSKDINILELTLQRKKLRYTFYHYGWPLKYYLFLKFFIIN